MIEFGNIIDILTLSSFPRLCVILSILRIGFGLSGFGFGVAVFALSAAVTFDLMQPHLGGLKSWHEVLAANPGELHKMLSVYAANIAGIDPTAANLQTIFLQKELMTAFAIGLQLVMPFVLIDIALVFVASFIGLGGLPVRAIGLPLKLLLFTSVGGWNLVVTTLSA